MAAHATTSPSRNGKSGTLRGHALACAANSSCGTSRDDARDGHDKLRVS